MNTSTVTVTGTVVFDPVMRTTETGQVVTNVRVAANDRRLNRTTQEWEDVNTSFYNVSCWRVLGERVSASIRKGDPVFFSGRQLVREFTREGGHADHSVDVDADVFGPDLRRVTVTVNRKPRGNAQPETPAAETPTSTPESEQPTPIDPFSSSLTRSEVAEPAA